MSNELLTISMVTFEALVVLENTMKVTQNINREYDDKFAVAGAKIGDTLNIRKPPRYLGRDGQALSVENTTETSVPLTLNHQFGCDVEFSSTERALSLDDFSRRILRPQVATVANKIDRLMCSQYINIANTVGVPGVVPTALLTYMQAGQKLMEEAVPDDGMWTIAMTPAMQVGIVDALKGLFQQSSAIASQYASGKMGHAVNFDWIMDQNIYTHVVGPLGGTPLVDGANQTGNSLVTDGWTNDLPIVVKKGDILTLGTTSGVFAVNPQNRESTGSLRQFVVTADTGSGASTGPATIPIYPAITPGGQFQTVDSSPANNATIQIFGHASTYANVRTPAGLAFHRDFATLAIADLPLPGGTDRAAKVSSKKLGVALRMIQDYNINTDKFPLRLDVLCGAATLYPEFAARIQS